MNAVYTAYTAYTAYTYTERMQSCVPHHIHDHFRVSASDSHLTATSSTLLAFGCFRAWAGSYLFAHTDTIAHINQGHLLRRL